LRPGSKRPETWAHRKSFTIGAASGLDPFDTGGLIGYGRNYIDQYRRAVSYVDRILKGEKPADLPVQAPTKYGKASRPPGRAADQVRSGHQPDHRHGATTEWRLAVRAG
jgi:hypothetical protein